MTAPAVMDELIGPLRADPARSAVLLDVDGTLAPIVRHADDAWVNETTRAAVTAVAKRYGVVACVSGRRAADARRIVSIGSIAYVGSHGGEVLRPGGSTPELDPRLAEWTRRIGDLIAELSRSKELSVLRVRIEDKAVIAALHWRGAPDEAAAHQAVRDIATRAESEGLVTHWGRKVLEVRPPVRLNKGEGIHRLLDGADLAGVLYAGDDATDLDAFRALEELRAGGRAEAIVRVGVRSDEGPAEIIDRADLVVDGTPGVDELLRALLDEA